MAVSRFRQRARQALQDQRLQRAIRVSTNKFMAGRRAVLAEMTSLADQGLVRGDFAAMRERARAIKNHTIGHLDYYLGQAADAIARRGGQVHYAADAAEVGAIVSDIARRRGVSLAVKSKSMATEEVHLNAALQGAGVEVVETDLGEYIIQLAGETPSHIVTPCIHKSRDQIGKLFGEVVGRALPTDTPTLTAVARQVLREKFISAGLGISGANFVVAETGTICMVTNEGNGRLVTSAPPVHVAVVGIEKLVPGMADLSLFLALLARSATGQKISVYTHLITGPRAPGEADGPEELHVVFMDAGRSGILGTDFQEALNCIRCGSCLNHCPVYRNTGGHAYGGVYSGPIGVVLNPLLGNFGDWKALPAEACSLCAACWEACPVAIPLHDLILGHRRQMVSAGLDDSGLGPPLRATARAWTRPWAYRLSLRAGRAALRWFARDKGDGRRWVVRGPGPLQGWTAGRDLPAPARQSFRELWAAHVRERGQRT